MKEGWEYIALSSVCKVQNGFAFDSKLFNDSNNGLPLIRIRDIKRGYTLTCTTETCSEEFFVENGDMLIGMDGDFNIGEWKGGHALLNQRVCKLIPSEKVLAKFIFYFIPEALQKINDKTAFSTVKHLSSKQVNAILLPNLPISEQQSIVDYLDSAFAKIDAMKANAEKALNEAKSLFQASLKEMLEPKEGWEYKKLGEVCDFEGGSQPPKSEWINHPQNGYIRMLQIRDFTKSRNAEIEYVKITKKLRLCKDDDILIGRYGASVGKILTGLAGAYNVAIIKSIPNEELIKKDFIRRYFESPLFQSILFKVCTSRAAQAGFSKDDIKDELIPLPPLSEQQSIVATLDSLKSKVDRLQANYDKISQECDALKQAMLRQIFE
jgi:type I restriction enzyme S subunit